MKWITYVVGILLGWELGEEHNRLVEPIVNSERWNRELKSAVFERIDIFADGYLLNNIIARAAPEGKSKRITILRRDYLSQSSE